MNVDDEVRETCAVCGGEAEDGRWFCHFYHKGVKVSFCSPVCVEAFLDLPSELRSVNGAPDVEVPKAGVLAQI